MREIASFIEFAKLVETNCFYTTYKYDFLFSAYQCPKCPSAFKRSDHLRSHLRHRHKNTLQVTEYPNKNVTKMNVNKKANIELLSQD